MAQESGSTGGGVAPNVMALLGYLLLIPAILCVAMEPYKRDPFLRFHGYQALIMCLAMFALNFCLRFAMVFMGPLALALLMLNPLFGLVCIFCGIKAYQNEKFKLPVIGDMAEQQAAKG